MKNVFGNRVIEYLMNVKNYSVMELRAAGDIPPVWCAKNIIDGVESYLIFLDQQQYGNAYYYRDALINSLSYNGNVDINFVFLTMNTDDYFNNMVKNLLNSGFNGGVFGVIASSGNVLRMSYSSDYIYHDLCEAAKKVYSANRKASSKDVLGKLKENKCTAIFIAANIFMFIVSAILSKSIFNINHETLVTLGAKVNYKINEGEVLRLVKCMFLHGGIVHIGFNMYALYMLGPLIEKIYGKSKFVTIYFISGIISSLASYIFSQSTSVGASGAIFGLLGAALIYGYRMRGSIGKEFMSSILQVITINIVIGLTLPNIDNFGHMGGLLGGILISMLVSLRK